ncbi:MAG: DUF6421 family protein, partial [Micrococcales bacterium]
MQKIARILIDQAHNQAWAVKPEVAARMNSANPSDASYSKMAQLAATSEFQVDLHESGLFTADALASADILVIPHASSDEWEKTIGVGSPVLTPQELEEIERFVSTGGSLLLLAETEQPKYGNNFAELAAKFGVEIKNATVQDPSRAYKDVPTWIIGEFNRLTKSDFAFLVDQVCLYRAGALDVASNADAEVFMRTSEHASPALAPLGVAVQHGLGRVVVLADSDLFGDDSIDDCDNKQLWLNIAGWLANARAAANADAKREPSRFLNDSNWQKLAAAIEDLRPMQAKDGSIDGTAHSHAEASALVDQVIAAIDGLAPNFEHQHQYLVEVKKDIENWRKGGFGVPDYFNSLELFRPDLNRKNSVQHLAVFSMYTQNGNPNRNLEAVITNTFWPDWLADKEKKYNNPAFIP